MSRIFDALRQAAMEQSGVEYPDTMSVAHEVLESQAESQFGAAAQRATVAASDEISASGLLVDTVQDFPVLDVTVPEESRAVFWTQPTSLAVEKFRFLNVRLRELRQTRPLKRVLITSSIPEEGKSLVSANVTGAISRKKDRVLLIEGDMRRPVLAPEFGVSRMEGLSEWLQGSAQMPSNIYHLKSLGFWFMPAGFPPERPLELMQSGRLAQLMKQVSEMFDWVIVDSPPLLPLADSSVWLRLCDGALLVTREGVTEKQQLERSLEIVNKEQLLGVVLNGSTSPDQKNYYQRYAPAAK